MISGNQAFNIGALFTQVFGISSPIYLPWGREMEDYNPGDYQGITTVSPEVAETYSWMGTPVIGTFILDGRKYYTYNDDGSRGEINLASFTMPYATLVDFSRSMNVTKTKVLGNAGTVKEIYGLDDWSINIRGFCMTDKARNGSKTVEEQVNALVNYGKVTEAIGVTGLLFNQKGIYSMVIDELSFNPIQGNSSVVPFTIRATSDNPLELKR